MHGARAIAWKLGVCAFALNFAWEMLQARYFEGMSQLPWWAATKLCLRATVGDVFIILVAYLAVALGVRDARWPFREDARKYLGFMLLSAALALALEWWSVELGRWRYVPGMPVAPWVKVGLAPLLQWAFLPLLSMWIVRRLAR